MTAHTIYLASLSPRRSELLAQIGVPHEILPVSVNETVYPDETAAEYVMRLAQTKAEAGVSLISGRPPLPVLAADTAVVVDDHILGKPADREEALAMMALLSDRRHRVLTGVALAGQTSDSRLSISEVTFRPVGHDEALAYWQSGEPADKAGGYGIQGLGAIFISHLEGSFSGVMGLPLFETGQLLQGAGILALGQGNPGD